MISDCEADVESRQIVMNKKLGHAAAVFVAAMVIIECGIFWNLREKLAQGYQDFTAFYAAGLSVRQGHGAEIYDPVEQWRAQRQFASNVAIRPGPLPYLHPPFEALLFAPFTLMAY